MALQVALKLLLGGSNLILGNLKIIESKDAADAKVNVASIYDLTKRIIGLMFTLVVAIIVFVINNFVTKGK